MTRIPTILGSAYDAAATLPDSLDLYEAKRTSALGALNRAEREGDAETVKLMKWELGLTDLHLAVQDGASPFGGGEYDRYAEFYGLTGETVDYARERASETQDVILKLHYLEFNLLRSNGSGRKWIDLQRELLSIWRSYIDGCMSAPSKDHNDFVGVNVDQALIAVGRLFGCGGVVRPNEAKGCAEWLVSIAEQSRDLPVRDDKERAQQRHRWVADYLFHITELPESSIDPHLRKRALDLIAEAEAYYIATPLNDTFVQRVAEVEASLRKHFGERGTHEAMVRKQVAALKQRAEFHQATGNGLLTSHFFREARRMVETHRQYFSEEQTTSLSLSERAAIQTGVEAGEFGEITIPLTIPAAAMDFTEASPEATVTRLYAESVASVPNRARLESDQRAVNEESPLQSMISRSVIGAEKVVGEAYSPEENLVLDVEARTVLMAQLFGGAVAVTVVSAAEKVGLAASHLMAPLSALDLDAGSRAIIERGCERFIAQDFVSAAHILIPHIEDVIRQHLTSLGADTQKFKRDNEGNTSRTDDATLGRLLIQVKLPDGTEVRTHLGEDLWYYLDTLLNSQTGLNLRHAFAHGLARPNHTGPENVGIALSLLYLLASVAANRDVPNECPLDGSLDRPKKE